MATTFNPQPAKESTKWQDKLDDYCVQAKVNAPVYNFVSDRRGGRTAWSTSVTVQNPNTMYVCTFAARYFYDGTNNAKEDAAEVAVKALPPLRG
ncbi:hypothetical protein BO78DRAFT_413155 [Aspergillus sclerotiicarbonarius CBS 121057]|uniref:DRBM domain-containing protein n=1 Tax=Aspergillus sclerotiicarbonarius (strain CBS 121057 / IBT 28362) TaxID=1448318 RepID=A0A319EP21_ASPSB|nr:hypothetical protein BO78DRAFT_413155 [Aspergillus sclerotiicarbonarius CBS 121057]